MTCTAASSSRRWTSRPADRTHTQIPGQEPGLDARRLGEHGSGGPVAVPELSDHMHVVEDYTLLAESLGGLRPPLGPGGLAMYPMVSLVFDTEDDARAAGPPLASVSVEGKGPLFARIRVEGKTVTFGIDYMLGCEDSAMLRFRPPGNGESGEVVARRRSSASPGNPGSAASTPATTSRRNPDRRGRRHRTRPVAQRGGCARRGTVTARQCPGRGTRRIDAGHPVVVRLIVVTPVPAVPDRAPPASYRGGRPAQQVNVLVSNYMCLPKWQRWLDNFSGGCRLATPGIGRIHFAR